MTPEQDGYKALLEETYLKKLKVRALTICCTIFETRVEAPLGN